MVEGDFVAWCCSVRAGIVAVVPVAGCHDSEDVLIGGPPASREPSQSSTRNAVSVKTAVQSILHQKRRVQTFKLSHTSRGIGAATFLHFADMLSSASAAGRAAFGTSSRTTAVRSAHALDESVLCKYLASALPNFEWSESALRLRQFSHGQSNPTYTLETANGEPMVLRKQPPGKILRGAHAVDREAQVMSALHGVVPVPTVVHFESDASVLGTPFFLYRYVDGIHIPDSEASSLTEAQRSSAFGSMANTLAQYVMLCGHTLAPFLPSLPQDKNEPQGEPAH